MNQRLLLFIVFIGLWVSAKAQTNLITNPSFEDKTGCWNFGAASSIIQLTTAQYAVRSSFPNVTDWISATGGTPDYYSVCANNIPAMSGYFGVPNNFWGTRSPRTGDAYAGVVYNAASANGPASTEYLETKLSVPMIAGHQYYVSFYTCVGTLSIGQRMGLDNWGLLFHNAWQATLVSQLPASAGVMNPVGHFVTDAVNWTKIDGIYTATGGEQWAVLGAFDRGGASAIQTIPPIVNNAIFNSYFYIDDVTVIDLDSATRTSRNINICNTDTPYAIVTPRVGGKYSYLWNTGDTTASIKASQTGVYWLRGISDTGSFIDTVHLNIYHAQPLGKPLTDTLLCSIDSIVIGTQGTYDAYEWNTGATTPTITVRTSGKYILTTTNFCNGKQSDSANIVIARITTPVVFDTTICQGTTVPTLRSTADSLRWYAKPDSKTFYTTQPYASSAQPDTITFYVTQNTICGESPKVPVHINILPAELTATITDNNPGELCAGDSVLLKVSANRDATFIWSTGSVEDMIAVRDSGSYNVIAINTCASDTITANKYSFPDCKLCLQIPNAFTPNADGRNDVFRAIAHCRINDFILKIYNRWGALVFEANDMSNVWDGTLNGQPLEIGTYFYILSYTTDTPHPYHSASKGEVVLIR